MAAAHPANAETPGLRGQPASGDPAWDIDPYVDRPYGYTHRLPKSPNGRDPLNGMPWQVRAILLLGVPSVIALAAVWWGAGVIGVTVADTQRLLLELQQHEQLHDQNVRTNFIGIQRQTETQIRLLRSICASVAKSDVARERCNE